MEFTTQYVLSEAKSLSAYQLRLVRKLVGEGDRLSAGQAMVYWVVELLNQVNLCDKEQINLIAEEFSKTIETIGNKIAKAVKENNTNLLVAYIVFGDRKYLAITDGGDFLDLDSGYRISAPRSILENVQYNLTTLFTRKIRNEHKPTSKVTESI